MPHELLNIRKLGNFQKIAEMLGFDSEYPAAQPKAKLWHFLVKNHKISAVKHSTEKNLLCWISSICLQHIVQDYSWWGLPEAEAVVRRCSVEKVFLEMLQNSQENTCAGVSFLIKLQTSGEIFKNTFFTEHLVTTGSDEGVLQVVLFTFCVSSNQWKHTV